ncbi:hypothetical protein AB4254_11660 [Vibrio breoganii]
MYLYIVIFIVIVLVAVGLILRAKNMGLMIANDDLTRDLQTKTDEIEELKRHIAHTKAAFSELEERCSDMSTKLDNWPSELKQLQQQWNSDNNHQLLALRRENHELKGYLSTFDSDADLSMEKVRFIENMIQRLLAALCNLETQKDSYQRMLDWMISINYADNERLNAYYQCLESDQRGSDLVFIQQEQIVRLPSSRQDIDPYIQDWERFFEALKVDRYVKLTSIHN